MTGWRYGAYRGDPCDCSECGRRVLPGDEIKRRTLDDGAVEYAHRWHRRARKGKA